MRVARICWLIGLTLVASTLPSSAWAGPVRKPSRAVACRQCAPAAPSSPDRQRKSNRIKIAPNNEMWDGSSNRAVGHSPGLVLIDALAAERPAPRFSPAFFVFGRLEIAAAQSSPSQAAWLIGHYPHAPPQA